MPLRRGTGWSVVPAILCSLMTAVSADQFGDFTYTDNGNSTATITGYTGAGGVVNIPGTVNGLPVSAIGYRAFYNHADITTVIIPAGVTSIGPEAFNSCKGLTSVTIPNSVTSIRGHAFRDCFSLPDVFLPDSVLQIGQSCFLGCRSLTSLAIPASVTSIGDYAFYGCVQLTSANLPFGILTIGNNLFVGCSALINMDIPASVTSIGSGAFWGCNGLKNVTIPSSVTAIGTSAFQGCSGLTMVKIPANVTTIPDYVFAGCARLKGAVFDGNAPSMGLGVFDQSLPGFKVYYHAYMTGFTTPTWQGYAALPMEAPLFTSAPPPSGRTGTAYNHTFAATGVPLPSYAVTSGGLPPGLSLSTSGVVSGTPTAAGVFAGNVGASNGAQPDATQEFSITIIQPDPPSFTSAPPPSGKVGVEYSHTFAATGAPPPSFALTSGALPPGLGLSTSGVISGTPTTRGRYVGTITASNGVLPNATQAFAITVSQAPAFTSAPPPGGEVGTYYSHSCTASGSTPISFALTSGNLPDGLSLSSWGAISGTPTSGGTFSCEITASNGVPPDATQPFSIVIVVPTHDRFAFRTTIPAETYVLTGNSAGATKEPGEPAHVGDAGGASVWWTWTAPADGATTVSTAGSGFDTLLAVYTGGAVGALALVAANDDDPAGGTTSRVGFTAAAGTVYQIAVDGKNGATGDIRLTITPPIAARELGAPRVEPNGGTWRITPPWPVPGRRYRLQYSDTMTRGTWLDVPPERTVVAGEPFVLEMARDSAVARRFFRMSLDPGRVPEGFVWVPPGTFWMGSPADEAGRESNETRHEVTLTRGLWLEATEVSWAGWSAVRSRAAEKGYSDLGAGRNGLSGDAGGLHPVTEVSWWDAVKWCNLRSELEGRTPVYYKTAGFGAANVLRAGSGAIYADWNADGYRLPSEAEWEHACRAGTTSAFWSGPITQTGSTPLDPALDLAGWYGGNAGSNSHPGGEKAANAWGLSDTHGNVWEWCWDFYGSYGTASQTDPRGPGSGNWRVLRGGSVTNVAKGCRAAFRALVLPGERVNTHGFRVAVGAAD